MAYEQFSGLPISCFGALPRGVVALGEDRRFHSQEETERGRRGARRFRYYHGRDPDTARPHHRIQLFGGRQPVRSTQKLRGGGGQCNRYGVHPGRLPASRRRGESPCTTEELSPSTRFVL